MQVAVYSGSFDPLHIGHLAIMKYLTSPEIGFDKVYLVVSPRNPLKDGSREYTAEQRLEAAKEAVSRHPELRVEVNDVEFTLPSPQYTIRTLDTLKEREKDNSFSLVIGADNLAVFRGWRDYKRILLEYGIIVYPRTGFDSAALRDNLLKENGEYRIRLIDAPLMDVSSTQIRELLREHKDANELLM